MLQQLIKNNCIYAHTKEDKNNKQILYETLSEHSSKTLKYFYKLNSQFDYDKILQTLIKNILHNEDISHLEIENEINKIILDMIYLHDIGKINVGFQYYKMNNDIEGDRECKYTYHSSLSALLFLDKYDKITNKKKYSKNRKEDKIIKNLLRDVILRCSYLIKCHHTGLSNFDYQKYIHELKLLEEQLLTQQLIKNYHNSIDIDFSKYEMNVYNDENYITIYIFYKFLYSILITCDSFATYEYQNNEEVTFNVFDETQIKNTIKQYQSTEVCKSIAKYKRDNSVLKDNDINKLRCELFLESERELLVNLDKYMYFLEACTGSGKTNMSQNLALALLKQLKSLNKIIYVFPFNTLVEQTQSVLNDNFKDLDIDIVAINSNEEIKSDNDEYDKDFLKYQFIQYPIALTSHVNLFNMIFGYNRKTNLSFSQLANSVIILDEIQSYNHLLWNKTIEMFEPLTKLLNIRFIIMSATLPNLDLFLEDYQRSKICKLIKNPQQYYQNPIFKNRVHLDFTMLDKDIVDFNDIVHKLDEVIKDDTKGNRILIELIKTESVGVLYQKIKDRYKGFQIEKLTSKDSYSYRQRIIDYINAKDELGRLKNTKIILISTQLIEAGVDIDMDIGFKDISILENEEQFLGRLNRSAKRKGYAYFFNMDRTSDVYQEDFRISYDLRHKRTQQCLIDKDFTKYYLKCITHLKEESHTYNKHNLDQFKQNLVNLQFKTVYQNMQLIESKNVQLYILCKYKTQDGKIIDSEQILNTYKDLKHIKKFSEKHIKKSRLKKQMNLFTYDYPIYNNKYPAHYSDIIDNHLYIVQNGQDLIENKDNEFMTYKSTFMFNTYTQLSC